MSTIHLTTRPDAVVVLTFDQPGSKANILSADLWTELEAVLEDLTARAGLKGLVLASGKPGIFIAGADLKLLANAPGPGDPEVRGFIEQGVRVLAKLEELPFPTCAAIDGAALGGGLEVALACDYRIAGSSEKFRIGLPEVTLGLIPGWGGTQRLPRIVGLMQAAELLTTGAAIDRERATAIGLIDRSAPTDTLIETAAVEVLARGHELLQRRLQKQLPIAQELRSAFTSANGLNPAAVEAVRAMATGAEATLPAAIAVETAAFLRLAGSEDSKQRIAEFFASRKK